MGFNKRIAKYIICYLNTKVNIIFFIYLIYAKHIFNIGPPRGLIKSYILILKDIL
jgi:hypothetical protein